MQSPIWVYSNRAGNLKYSREHFPSLDEFSLKKGWNFVTFSPEITGNSFNQIKEDCTLKRLYFWSNLAQKWVEFSKSEIVDKEYEGTGLIIEVSNDCTLGIQNSLDTIPSLPPTSLEGFETGGIYPSNIGDYKLLESDEDSEDCDDISKNGINGTACAKSIRLTYSNRTNPDDLNYDVFFVYLTTITKGKDIYKSVANNFPKKFYNSRTIYFPERCEILWFSDRFADTITIMKARATKDSDGSSSYSYQDSINENNPLFKWFFENSLD